MAYGTACKHGELARQCDRCESEREIARLRARAERLETAIRDAPHSDHCAVYRCARSMVNRNGPCDASLITHLTGGPWHEFVPGKCDCWKRDALEDKL